MSGYSPKMFYKVKIIAISSPLPLGEGQGEGAMSIPYS